MTLHAPNKLFLKSSSSSLLSFRVLLPCIWTGLPCPRLRLKGFHVVHSLQIIQGQKTVGQQHAPCVFFLPLERGYGGWRKKRAEQHKVNKFVFLEVEFSEIRTKNRKKKKKAFSFYSPWLSQVQAGIFIPPGENANHQSQAACYVSV